MNAVDCGEGAQLFWLGSMAEARRTLNKGDYSEGSQLLWFGAFAKAHSTLNKGAYGALRRYRFERGAFAEARRTLNKGLTAHFAVIALSAALLRRHAAL